LLVSIERAAELAANAVDAALDRSLGDAEAPRDFGCRAPFQNHHERRLTLLRPMRPEAIEGLEQVKALGCQVGRVLSGRRLE
jgi:hypothetical protein